MVKEISREELKAKMDWRDDSVLVEIVETLSRRHYESSRRPGEIGYNVIFEFDRESNLEE